jgi:para-nitrobenzyl esterase
MTLVVRTPYGLVAGNQENDVAVFRGIPYARPPVGELRFRAPLPPEPWDGPRDATRFGPIAMQNPSPMDSVFGRVERPAASEDCLTLNVWTPAVSSEFLVPGSESAPFQPGARNQGPGTRRPVMVWIHGGAFVGGSGSTPWYDGTSFAARGDVVLVTLNYRLGALGFLHLADLGGDAFAGSGNIGILDQVAALRWVRDSIAAFGGDPENVTIFGESAGAMSVGTLLGLPEARGLFRRAILQSGGAGNIKPAEAATEIARQMLAALDLGPHQLESLRTVPAEALLTAQAKVTEANRGGTGIPFEPVIDGTVLPGPVLDSVAAGEAAGGVDARGHNPG